MAADDPRDGHSPDWRPVPDPTTLTTEQLRRELSALREILTARLDGMDRATMLLDETVNRIPTEIQTQIAHLKELIETRLDSQERLSLTRLAGIEQQFAERDIRATALNEANSAALAAALRAAKELGDLQTQANTLANAKTEESVAQQLVALADKIDLNSARLDRAEGSIVGSSGYRTERRLDSMQIIAVVSALAAVAVIILYLVKK